MPRKQKLSRSEWIDLLLTEAEALPSERPAKRRPPKKRGPMRDNSRNIAVHMTEEQFQRLERYRNMTRHCVTTYFRKLIDGDRLIGRRTDFYRNIHAGVNMIYSNVRQIERNPYARELDAESVGKMVYLAKKLTDEIFYLSCHE